MLSFCLVISFFSFGKLESNAAKGETVFTPTTSIEYKFIVDVSYNKTNLLTLVNFSSGGQKYIRFNVPLDAVTNSISQYLTFEYSYNFNFTKKYSGNILLYSAIESDQFDLYLDFYNSANQMFYTIPVFDFFTLKRGATN